MSSLYVFGKYWKYAYIFMPIHTIIIILEQILKKIPVLQQNYFQKTIKDGAASVNWLYLPVDEKKMNCGSSHVWIRRLFFETAAVFF